MQINSINREVIEQPYTRIIEREFNKKLFKNTSIKIDPKNPDQADFEDFKMDDMLDASDYLVKALFAITDEEFKSLTAEEFRQLEDRAKEIKGEKIPSGNSK